MGAVATELFESLRGQCEAEIVSARLLETRMTGHFDLLLADWLLQRFEQWWNLGGHNISVFHDWEGVSDYDVEVRARIGDWIGRHRERFDRAHVLVRSMPAAWGIRVFNNITGGLVTAYSDRAAFEAAREAARTALR